MQVSAESASQFGELVADPDTNELLHYTEKPETFVSTSSDILLKS
jgi:mannose-1-phosphate guanylyltransferase